MTAGSEYAGTPPQPRAQGWPWLLCLWVLAAVWWLGVPFTGPELKDGLLYSGEAMRQLHPQNFAKDPFFLGTSQGSYTIFGTLYSQAILWLGGLKPAGLLMSSLGRLLWLAAAVCLVRAWRGPWVRVLLPLLVMLAMPTSYDGRQLFQYGEATVTSRCWAEACVLFALAAWFGGRRWWWPVGLMALAAALHPLMALPGALLLLGLQRPRVRNIGLVLGLVGVLVLALSGVQPFANLLAQYDDLWWQRVNEVNAYVLIQHWPAQSYSKMLGWLALLIWVALCHPDAVMARFGRVLAVVYVLCILAWVLGCLSHNVLLVQLQPWRVLWVVQLLAPALWVMGLPAWREWCWRDWAQILLVLAGLLSTSWGISLLVVPALLLKHPLAERLGETRLLRAALLLLPLAALLMLMPARYQAMVTQAYTWRFWGMPFAHVWALCAEPVVLFIAMGGLAWVAARQSRWLRWGLLGGGSAALMAAVGVMVSFQLFQATRVPPDVRQLQQIIPPGSVVYWNAGAERVWFLLERAQYAGPLQGAGTLFSREAAMEFFRRIDRLKAADPKISGFERAVAPDGSELADPMGVVEFCRDPVLDFVIVGGPYPLAEHYVPYTGNNYQAVSVIDCRQLRKVQL